MNERLGCPWAKEPLTRELLVSPRGVFVFVELDLRSALGETIGPSIG